MTSTVDRSAPDEAPERSPRWWERWWHRLQRRLPHGRMRWVALAALGLLAVLAVTVAVYAWWLGGGLLSVYNTAQDKADIAQKQLTKFQKSVEAGDREGAARHLRIAERAVDEAEDAAKKPQVRVAKWLPYTRGTVADLDHLLNAASVVIDSAGDVFTVYTQFAGEDSKLFDNGKIDTQALLDGREAFRNVRESLATAKDELRRGQGHRSAWRRRAGAPQDRSQADPHAAGQDQALRAGGRGDARRPRRRGHLAATWSR